jgi:hypothetical protein
MDFLKKLPALLRQHYEKALLGLALAALVLSGLLLASQKQKQEEWIKDYMIEASRRKPFPYTNVNWSPYFDAAKKATNPMAVDFTRPRLHNLFGPVKWQRRPDDRLIKIEVGNEVGAEALKVTKVVPLYLTITVDKASGANGYFLSVTREGATNAFLRKKFQSYVTPGNKDRLNTFVLKEVKGTGDEADLDLELLDSGEKIAVSTNKPFKRVDGYKTDLSYPPENKSFSEKRVDETVTLGGEDYIIVAISQDEVVLSARSNNKRTTLRYNAAP